MNQLRALALALIFVAAQATPISAQGPANSGKLVQLDFADVELSALIETIARITGKNFIYDDRVRGRVTIVSPSSITVDQAYAVFEAVLKVKGFTAVPGPGGVMKIIAIREAKESSIETIRDDRASENRDRYVTRLIPLKYIDAESITATIKPLVPKDASMVAYPATNMIIVTDTDANIRRLLSILEALDVETYKEDLEVIAIEHADASILGQQVAEIYGATLTGTTSTRRARTRGRAQAQPATPTAAGGANASRVRIITDDRTNSLLVLAPRDQMIEVRALVAQLDVPVVGGGRIHVYYLQHADAEELSQTLNSMLSGQRSAPVASTGAAGTSPQALRSTVTALAEGITLTADPSTNSLVIQASREAFDALSQVIDKLDIARPQVLVEALIMEVDVSNGLELGFNGLIRIVNGNTDLTFSTVTDPSTASIIGTGVGGPVGGAAAPFLANFARSTLTDDDGDGQPDDGTLIQGVIRASANDDNVDIVSAPHILTSDNEEAEIRIGANIPIITSRVESAQGQNIGLSSSVNVERQDIGVTLRVTPQISEGNSLRLKIFQEITAVNETLGQTTGSAGRRGRRPQQPPHREYGRRSGRGDGGDRRADRGGLRRQRDQGSLPGRHPLHRMGVQEHLPLRSQREPARLPHAPHRSRRGIARGPEHSQARGVPPPGRQAPRAERRGATRSRGRGSRALRSFWQPGAGRRHEP